MQFSLVPILYLGGPTSNKSLQDLVLRLSTEVWHSPKLTWVQALLKELDVPFSAPILLYDNQSAVAIAHNPVFHSQTKHM